ncbi:MAG: tetratricopeptide repeat protein [Sulfuricellaceae bacterium]
MDITALLAQTRHAMQTGQLAEAENLCRTAHESAPMDPSVLHMLGLALALRHDYDEALPLLERAVQLQPGEPEFLFDLARAQHNAGKDDEAMAAYRQTIKLAPAWPAPWINLASLLLNHARAAEAVDLLQRALQRIPEDADLSNTLGNALGRLGYHQEALAAYRQSAQLAPARPDILHNQAYTHHRLGEHAAALAVVMEGLSQSPEHLGLKVLAGNILCQYRPAHYMPSHANLLATALKEGWSETTALSSAAWDLLGLVPGHGLEPQQPHPLLLSVLRHGLVNHPWWEIRLTDLRKQWLGDVLGAPHFPSEQLELATALAEQCFHNEYVFTLTAEEKQQLDLLAKHLSQRGFAGEKLHGALAVYAAYRPLATLSAQLPQRQALPPCLDELFHQQVSAPQEEAEIASALPRLTPIAQGLSERVQQQYEENPYPRWNSVPLLAPTGSPNQAMVALFPDHAPFSLPASPKILIAGTGTGLNAILAARRFPTADILAIDLSRASLAYAARKARELGHTNIHFAQADILNLTSWPERFHVIESVGVLHHMSDTLGAWRILANLLAPGGVMKIGLYSRLGRTDLKPLQESIRKHGLVGTADEIRTVRAQALAPEAPSDWAAITVRHDFYTLSTCRDLLCLSQISSG